MTVAVSVTKCVVLFKETRMYGDTRCLLSVADPEALVVSDVFR